MAVPRRLFLERNLQCVSVSGRRRASRPVFKCIDLQEGYEVTQVRQAIILWLNADVAAAGIRGGQLRRQIIHGSRRYDPQVGNGLLHARHAA